MSALRGDEADLFRKHHDHLARAVRRTVRAPDALIEDACGWAWEQLVRTQPDRGPRLFGWLRTVAVHEAYRLSKVQRRDTELEQLVCRKDDGDSAGEGWEHVIPARTDLDAHLHAKEALAVLASLPGRQRQYLTLLVGGHRYSEIVGATGATYTNVNKHLAKARASVRAMQEAA
jgi:DNA-directed RNA polymerase specialized sigma24 family protein